MSRPSAGLSGLSGLAWILGAALALPLAADPHPNVAIGFSPDKSYAIGDVDSINLFNGSVTVTVPIGIAYPVGGTLSYQLTLVHDANPWTVIQTTDSTQTIYSESIPSTCANAGLGWRVTLGELDPYCSPSDSGLHLYQDPSGADHVFYPVLHAGETAVPGYFYTADGTYLRLHWTDPTAEVDFPDGTIRSFQKVAVTDPNHPGTVLFYRWRMTRMQDPFGNWMQVGYGTTAWTITDSQGRIHTIHLASGQWAGSPYYETIGSIDLAAFGGALATYTFHYAPTTIVRGFPCEDPTLGMSVPVAVLTSVTLPDQSSYDMSSAQDYNLPAPPAGCTQDSGDLLGLRLPTLGRIEWTYMTYRFSNPAGTHPKPWRINSPGVATRVTKNEQGAVLGTWSYATNLSAPPSPGEPSQELVNSVTNPLGQRTDHYFSVALDNVFAGWNGCDYGLPFSRRADTGGTAPLYLSRQSFRTSGALFKTEYVRYERDKAGLCAGGVEDLDRRVAKSRTAYADDGAVYAETDYSSFDGLGHYRNAATAGTFPTGNVRTRFTNFNPNNGTYTVDPDTDTASGNFTPIATSAKWILGTSNSHYDVENGVTGSYVETCYDGQTGFLLRQRAHVLASATQSATDAVTDYTKDGQGNLSAEKSYGGDVQRAVGTIGVCSLAPGSGLAAAPEYEIDYTYQYGVRASARYSGASFFSMNQVIDPPTGLVKQGTDTTGVLTTTYSYDALGRVTLVQPAQEAKTVYAYTPANPTTKALAGVDIQRQGASGTTLARQQLVFDALGRVYHETQKLADGSFNVRETLYDGMGHKASVSELQSGNAVQKTQYLGYDPEWGGRSTGRRST